MSKKDVRYAVKLRSVDGNMLYPSDTSLNCFKVCFAMTDTFVSKYERKPKEGDVYCLYRDFTKEIVSQEDYQAAPKMENLVYNA